MRPIKVSQTGVGSKVIPIDRFRDSTSLQVNVTGTATWTIQWTADNVYREEGPYQWNDPPAGALGGSADAAAVLTFPAYALKLEITGGAGSVELTILQAYSES